MRLALFFERVMQAMISSREREAERVVRRHAHFLSEAQAYERDRASAEAQANADAATVAQARTVMAQAGFQLSPRSTR
jgi:hypothetical protein